MLYSAEEMWNNLLNDIQTKVNKQSFDIWLKDTRGVSLEGDTLTVQVIDDTAKRHINNSFFNDLINRSLNELTGRSLILNLITENEANKNIAPTSVVSEPKNDVINNSSQGFNNFNKEKKYAEPASSLNPHYTFENFVVGNNNQLAHAASISISKHPATQYNPLFLYGDSGLGKTHLLQAIGHEILKAKPYLKVLYVTSEQFVNEFIQAIKNGTIHSFKIKYRNVDILLIDDIQFIERKEQTQEEFFHTFNDLHNNNKQIVISSDRPPKELSHLADRLKTRFEWGLITDIQAPNLETREAILRNKAEREGMDISDDILNYIARRIKSSIRALEAALTRLHVVASVHNEKISLQQAKIHLRPLFDVENNKQVTIDDIMGRVADRYSVTMDDLKSKSRHSSIIQPRFIAMYLSTKLTNLTTTEIGKNFGKRDHSTVINARNNIEKAMAENESLKEIVEDIIADLKA